MSLEYGHEYLDLLRHFCPGNIITCIIEIKWEDNPRRLTLATCDTSSQIKIWNMYGLNKQLIYILLYLIKFKTRLYKRKCILTDMIPFSSLAGGVISLITTFRGEKNLQGNHCLLQLKLNNKYAPLIACGSCDHTIRIWDIEKADNINTLQSQINNENITDMIQISDNFLVAKYGSFGLVKWDIIQRTVIQTFSVSAMSMLRISNNELIISGKVLNLENFQLTGKSYKLGYLATCMAIYRRYPLVIASGDCSGMIRLWEIENGSGLVSWKGHEIYIRSIIAVSIGKSSFLLTGSYDNYLKMWDSKKKCLFTYRFPYEVSTIVAIGGQIEENRSPFILAAARNNTSLWAINPRAVKDTEETTTNATIDNIKQKKKSVCIMQ